MSYTPAQIEKLKVQGNTKSLLFALKDKDSRTRKRAAFALAELADAGSVQPLVELLGSDNADIRRWAAWILGRIGDEEWVEEEFQEFAVEPLILAITDANDTVQRNAINALEDHADERALEPLIHVLNDNDHVVRMLAAGALGKLGDRRAESALLKALEDEDLEVRDTAMEALDLLEDPD